MVAVRSACLEKGRGGRVIMPRDVGWEELGKEGRGGEKAGGRRVLASRLLADRNNDVDGPVFPYGRVKSSRGKHPIGKTDVAL